MSVANIRSEWVGGDLIFKDDAGNELLRMEKSGVKTTIANLESTAFNLGTKVDYIADTADISDSVTVEKVNAIIADVNTIKEVFVTAGIMTASE